MNAVNSVESFTIPLKWKPVLIGDAAFSWHRVSPKPWRDRELIEGPRVYRWAFKKRTGEVEAVYIGQSEAFHNRIAGYRTPTKRNPKDTDVFVNSKFLSFEEREGTVELQFLDIAPFRVNGHLIDASIQSLGNHEVRLLLESVAILTAKLEHPHPKLLNRLSENVHKKGLGKLIQKMSPQQRVKALDLLKPQTHKSTRVDNATQK
jgi:hypothetical protein